MSIIQLPPREDSVPAPKITAQTLLDRKQAHLPITALTAYDYSTARLVDQAGIDMVLVGDSLGMAVLGYDSTLPVTMDEMLHHTRAVRRGTKRALLVTDMPYGSFHVSIEESVRNAVRLVKEGGAEAVKISQDHKGPIHLLLTDVVMPGMGGGKVAEHVKASRPDARILLMTGYTSRFEELEQSLGEPLRILHKPFDMQELHLSVQKALEGKPG